MATPDWRPPLKSPSSPAWPLQCHSLLLLWGSPRTWARAHHLCYPGREVWTETPTGNWGIILPSLEGTGILVSVLNIGLAGWAEWNTVKVWWSSLLSEDLPKFHLGCHEKEVSSSIACQWTFHKLKWALFALWKDESRASPSSFWFDKDSCPQRLLITHRSSVLTFWMLAWSEPCSSGQWPGSRWPWGCWSYYKHTLTSSVVC